MIAGSGALAQSGQHLTGEGLARYCADTGNNSAQNYCLGFIHSYFDSFTAGIWASSGRPVTHDDVGYCLPGSETVDGIRNSIVRYVGAHPEQAQQRAAFVISFAMMSAYPC